MQLFDCREGATRRSPPPNVECFSPIQGTDAHHFVIMFESIEVMKNYLVMLLLASLCFGLTAREDQNKRAISHGQDALLTIKVAGTRGGHSGDDIGRTGSALTILVDLLFPIDNL